ncbi:MAG: class I SAM-dependent methyltransferase [Rhodospirillales bacterium]|nr:class I SAM-dependent methyltransferase [Rhodospirillales bacterium]
MTAANREFIRSVLSAVIETDRTGLLIDNRARGLTGISGLKTVGLLQRLQRLFAADADACYLEIGVFQGLTLISAALEAPTMPCFGVDNFRILDPEGKNLSIVRERIAAFAVTNARLLNMDFEVALENLEDHLGGRRIAVYFVDGPHDYRSQIVCLLLAKKFLHKKAVIIIDDANYADVRMATRDFLLGHSEFRMVFEAYTPDHPMHLDAVTKAQAESGWLNGVNVLVRDANGLLPPMLPEVPADRSLYFNEWLTHRARLAELAPEALALADAVTRKDEVSERTARARLEAAYAIARSLFEERHSDRNVVSRGLTEGRINRLKSGSK